MTRPIRPTLADARHLVRELRATYAEDAPATLRPGVLLRLGLSDAYVLLDGPIGQIFVAYNNLGVSAVMRAPDPINFEHNFRARFGRPVERAAEHPADLIQAITDQLHGQHPPELHFDLRGLSAFERDVLLKALEIPVGEVRPYSWIAREIGRPKAVRAVGNALNGNPVPLLIPCHRVVRSDGHIGNYAFGSEAKRAVLAAEGAAPDVLETIASSGIRFLGDTADRTFCLPTCGGMHLRIKQHRHLLFHSEREAVAAGFEPCDSCRPIASV